MTVRRAFLEWPERDFIWMSRERQYKIFSAEEQPMFLRCSRRRFQTSKCKNEIRNAVFYKLASGVVSGNLSQETRVQPVVIGEALTLWLDEEGWLKLPMPRASDLLQTV